MLVSRICLKKVKKLSLILNTQTREAFVKACDLPFTAKNTLLSCPCWMVQWVNGKLHYLTFFSPCRAHTTLASICHNYLDFMIVWMNIFLHLISSTCQKQCDTQSCRQNFLKPWSVIPLFKLGCKPTLDKR